MEWNGIKNGMEWNKNRMENGIEWNKKWNKSGMESKTIPAMAFLGVFCCCACFNDSETKIVTFERHETTTVSTSILTSWARLHVATNVCYIADQPFILFCMCF